MLIGLPVRSTELSVERMERRQYLDARTEDREVADTDVAGVEHTQLK